MKFSRISDISYTLASKRITNSDLASEFEGWSEQKIEQKTGIIERTVVENACSSDLAVVAAEQLFEKGVNRNEIDYVLFCTQSPDYFLPTTACIIQDRLKLKTTCGALDFNLGCSGYVVGLGLAQGLIASDQARKVLLLTGETYSRMIDPSERSLRTIFGDAGSATIVEASEAPGLGSFVHGTNGSGAENLILRAGGFREPFSKEGLFMNGREIFNFTLDAVPKLIEDVLSKQGWNIEDVDLVLMHQANAFMLKHLVQKLGIPETKAPILMTYCGNTVSSTIPILIDQLRQAGRISSGIRTLVLGFGVGYSWSGCTHIF